MFETLALEFLLRFSTQPLRTVSSTSAGEKMYKYVSKYSEAFAAAVQVTGVYAYRGCSFY